MGKQAERLGLIKESNPIKFEEIRKLYFEKGGRVTVKQYNFEFTLNNLAKHFGPSGTRTKVNNPNWNTKNSKKVESSCKVIRKYGLNGMIKECIETKDIPYYETEGFEKVIYN